MQIIYDHSQATIAREMGMHYASIAMITDYDCYPIFKYSEINRLTFVTKIV